jgi:hypothetical protein
LFCLQYCIFIILMAKPNRLHIRYLFGLEVILLHRWAQDPLTR